tara:strand:+ start:1087 stop:1341 length:255 start_codon:yes stop_codon:yes gene_type:complete
MSKKKSYMNRDNLLSEGFFDKLKKFIKDKRVLKKVQNDPKVKNNLNKLNSSQKDFEKYLNKLLKDAGLEPNVKLSKFDVKDFIK